MRASMAGRFLKDLVVCAFLDNLFGCAVEISTTTEQTLMTGYKRGISFLNCSDYALINYNLNYLSGVT